MPKTALLDASGRLRRVSRGHGRVTGGSVADFGKVEVALVQVSPDDVGGMWVRVERVPAGVRGRLIDSDLNHLAVSYLFEPVARTWVFAGTNRSRSIGDTTPRRSWLEGIAADGQPLRAAAYVEIQIVTTLDTSLPTVEGAPSFASPPKVGQAVVVSPASIVNAGPSTTSSIAFRIANDNAGTGAASFAIADLTSMPIGAAAKYVQAVQTVSDPRQADIVVYGAWTYCAAAADTTITLSTPPAITSSPLVERGAFTISTGAINNATVSTVALLAYEMADAIVSGAPRMDLGGRRLRYTMPAIPANAVWISPTGNDSTGAGTRAAPYATFGKGKDQTPVGGTLVFKAGSYPEVYLDKAITIRPETILGAKIEASAEAYGGIRIAANYAQVLGFEVQGGASGYHGIVAENCHHAIIRGNYIHDARKNGISFAYGEFCTIEYNEFERCASLEWDSAISIYQLRAISGDTGAGSYFTLPGYRNVIRYNYGRDIVTYAWLAYDGAVGEIVEGDIVTAAGGKSAVVAKVLPASGTTGTIGFLDITANLFADNDALQVGGVTKAYANGDVTTWSHSDGNLIIMDDGWNSQNGSTAGNYLYPSLVEGNIGHNCGGGGIQVVWTDFVTVRRNTLWHNRQDRANPGTWRGEINVADSSYCLVDGNIAVADPARHASNSAINFAGASVQEWVADGGVDGTGPAGTLTGASRSVVSGRLRLTNSAAAQGALQIPLNTLTIGRSYTVSVAVTAGTAPGGVQIVDPATSTVLWSSATGSGTRTTTITPTKTSLRLDLLVGSATSGQAADFDNISFKPTVPVVGNVLKNTITFNGTAGQASIAVNDNGAYTDGGGNQLGVNPLLIAPPYDFRLQATSPALAAMTGTEAVELAIALVANRTMRRKLSIVRTVTDPSLGSPLTDRSAWVDVDEVPIPVLQAPAQFTSATLTQGGVFTRSEPTVDNVTTATASVVTYEDATGAGGAARAALAVSGQTMSAAARAYARPITTVSDPLLDHPIVAPGAWQAVATQGIATPTAPSVVASGAYLLYDGATKSYAPVFTIADDDGSYEFGVTLNPSAIVPETEIETAWVTIAGGKRRPVMTDAAKRIDPSTQTVAARTDYMCHKYVPGSPATWDGAGASPVRDALRSERWRIRRRKVVGGNRSEWSAFGAPLTFLPSLVIVPSTWPEDCIPIIPRYKEMADAKEEYGPGFQMVRDFATTPADPSIVICPMDVDKGWRSRDFGLNWDTPPLIGQYVARTGISAWIDPGDASRQLWLYGPGDGAKTLAAFGASSGLAASSDGGETCDMALTLPLLLGTIYDRHNLRLIAHHPTRGTTPATREVYVLACQQRSATDIGVGAISLWRSTTGHTGPFAKVVDLTPSTFCDNGTVTGGKTNGVWGIAFAPSGALYLWSEFGAWRAAPFGANAAPSFVKIASLPANTAVHSIGFSQGKVLIAVNKQSLWVGDQSAAGGAAGAFVRSAEFSAVARNGNTSQPLMIAVSPVDDRYIGVIVSGTGKAPMYTYTGVAGTWAYGRMVPLDGEFDWLATANTPDHCGIVAHESDKTKWLVWRAMNWGMSTDGLKTIVYCGDGYDGKHVRSVAMSPNGARVAIAGQDFGVMTSTAYASYGPGIAWWDDQITDKDGDVGDAIATAIGANLPHISGDALLVSDNGVVVALVGSAVSQARAPVVMWPKTSAGVTDPLGNWRVPARKSTVSRYGAWDPNNVGTRAFLGEDIVTFSGTTGDGVSFADLGKPFLGTSSDGAKTVVYGIEKGGGALWRRVWDPAKSGGAGWEAAWSAWVASGTGAGKAGDYCPRDSTPVACVDQHHKARVYACRGEGIVVCWEGETPTMRQVFRAQDHLPASCPAFYVAGFDVDHFDENTLWLGLFMYGVPTAWVSHNILATTPTWERAALDIPTMPLFGPTSLPDGTVWWGSQHGSRAIEPSPAYMAAHGLTNSIARRNRLFLEGVA